MERKLEEEAMSASVSACLILCIHNIRRLVTCLCVFLFVSACVCVEGANHRMRPAEAGAAGGSHSPQCDSPTGIVRTCVAGGPRG